MIPVYPIILLVRFLVSQRGGGKGTSHPQLWIPSLHGLVWVVLFISWLLGLAGVAVALAVWGDHPTSANLVVVLAFGAAEVFVGVWLFASFQLLRRLARRGNAKLVYYLAHLGLVGWRTGEGYAGATLLATVALAHRGDVTQAELAWLASRLAKEKRALGTFGTAHGYLEALAARVARDEGRGAEADDRMVRARALLGTVTYLSSRGVSRGVRLLAHEWLAMSDASLGYWGAFHAETNKPSPTIFKAFRAWVREKLAGEKAAWSERRALKKYQGPAFDAWLARKKEALPISSATAATRKAGETFAALSAGKAVGPRAALHMLAIYDALLDPRCPDTVLPEAERHDDAFVSGVQDTLAESLAGALALHGAPIYAMPSAGPVSSRVFQRLEVKVEDDLMRALKTIEERANMGWIRRSPLEDWLDTALLRALYRRLELTLGEPAAARVFPRFRSVYWKLALQLSENFPRMRPLAHAAFASLHRDAVRFGDTTNVPLLEQNLAITRGVV